MKTNLQAGKVRLVFVADDIPSELRRVVEFLNGQMDPAEVLAVEIKQYVGQGLAALVPRVIGQTVAAKDTKGIASLKSPRGSWDETSFLTSLTERSGSEAAIVARQLLAWVAEGQLRLLWSEGPKDGGFYVATIQGQLHHLFSAWTSGSVSISFANMLEAHSPFADESLRRILMDRLNAIPRVALDIKRIARFPSFPLVALRDEQALLTFFQTFEWAVATIQDNIPHTELHVP